jgi:hydroxymethylpyrimidine/phosphomethylpyrimidine kinase
MKSSRKQPTALTVAGSDSGGGAGIQADLRTFWALGVRGASAVTAVTCQNSHAILGMQVTKEVVVGLQIEAVCDEVRPRAVKTGMLANSAIIEVVAGLLKRHRLQNIVADPVIMSSSGRRLLSEQGVEAMYDDLLPLATLVTPNLDEANVLLGEEPIRSLDQMRLAAKALAANLGAAVLVKGGHLPDHSPAVDVLCVRGQLHEFRSARVPRAKLHGSGCIYSAAIAAWLARGEPLVEAVRKAKTYIAAQFRGCRLPRSPTA